MSDNAALFHIGDIISVCDGRLVTLTSARPRYSDGRGVMRDCPLHGVINILAHVSGNDLWVPGTDQSDWIKVRAVSGPVKNYLGATFQWARDFRIEAHDDLRTEAGLRKMFERETQRLSIDEWQQVVALPAPVHIPPQADRNHNLRLQ